MPDHTTIAERPSYAASEPARPPALRPGTMSSLIVAGYLFVFAATIALGAFMTTTMEQLRAITQDLYLHPFAVSNAAAEMKGSLFQLRNHMLQIVVIRDRHDDVARLIRETSAFETATRRNLEVIKENFLGDMNRVRTLEARLDEWAATRAEILAAVTRGDLRAAETLVREAGTPKFNEIVPHVDYVLDFARDRGKRFVREAEVYAEAKIATTHRLLVLAAVLIFVTGFAVVYRVSSLQAELNRQATLDFLTGVPNRRHFIGAAARELSRGRRYQTPVALAIVDLDFFKAVNDQYGHQVGDLVLRRFCDISRRALREIDLVGRIGGEEFAILLPSTGLTEAVEVVERLRAAVAAAEFDTPKGERLRVTASFGVAAHAGDDDTLDALLRRADEALYDAKHAGRNAVRTRTPASAA